MSNFRDVFKGDKDFKEIKKLKLNDDVKFLEGMAWQLDCVKNDFARELIEYHFPPSMESLVDEILDEYKEHIIDCLKTEIDEVETSVLDNYYADKEGK